VFDRRRVSSLRALPHRCAILTDDTMGRGGWKSANQPTTRAVWRFEPPEGLARILLCDDHAAELADHERLTFEAWRHDVTVESASA
jgi:hypothetical protein